jgi:L-aminopeptidase/D-esterase-like protein
LGARAGDLKGGLGSASIVTPEGLIVGALVAVNAVGSAVMPDSATLWAAPFEQDGEMGGQSMPKGPIAPGWPAAAKPSPVAGGNTTIAVIATNAALTPAQAKRLAIMAQDGLARAIRPAHTPFDGDSVFVLATGEQDLGANPPFILAVLGMLAADCLTRAIGRGVYEADSLGALESYRAKHNLR